MPYRLGDLYHRNSSHLGHSGSLPPISWRLHGRVREVRRRIWHRNDLRHQSRTLSVSLRETGKRLHAIFKPRLWPGEVQSLPAPSCVV